MRLSLRFILPLVLALAIIAYAVIPVVDNFTLKWFSKDMDTRATLIATTTQDTIAEFIDKNSKEKIEKLFNSMIQDERLYAAGFCNLDGKVTYQSANFPNTIDCTQLKQTFSPYNENREITNRYLRLSYLPIKNSRYYIGNLLLIQDMSFVKNRNNNMKSYVFYFFALLSIVISAVTVLVAQLSLKGWMNGLRSIIKGESLFRLPKDVLPEFKPIVKDLRSLIRKLESEKKLNSENNILWNSKSLKEILQKELSGNNEVIIVSNREPYSHIWQDGKIEIQSPASGLITALEPIMRACSGTWIAHGSGSADKQVVDKLDKVRVPVDNPSYQIKRIWLSKEEENGYYYGFSNEGLWPLCHIAHMRPIFRAKDWNIYKKVNQKFAQAVIAEAKTKNPVILIQDYHFALLPRLIKEKIPDAIIITFWHIPWPNFEKFGICPWREEIIDGLLGSNILGFHTRYHCNNFIDTVDRYLECRIDRENNNVIYRGKIIEVNPYPISIEWPSLSLNTDKSTIQCAQEVKSRHNFSKDHKIGIGVDRLDYTKGILERFLAVERFLELYPSWIGKFTFIQIAAPSRSEIEHYQDFGSQVRTLANRINIKYSFGTYQPICLKIEHHSQAQVKEYYRASDLCFVSSLHDGMNLVAKEYVASRDDELGVLILSQFTGASRELAEAIIVNPYDIDECANSINLALNMSKEEQNERMRSMRELIKEYNVFRWGGQMLLYE